MELAPHLWHFAGLGRVKVVVEFHPPVTIDQFGSRKGWPTIAARPSAGAWPRPSPAASSLTE
jgi:hypothetical protein